MSELSPWARQAIAAMQLRSRGRPIDRTLRVTLNFHPEPVLVGLARDGDYRSQFQTGTSNGAVGVGSRDRRWQWEHRIFDGAYDDAPVEQRPKYGALNHRHRSVGAAIRFGSAHVRLAEHMLDRATFCFPDSVLEPHRFGTAGHIDVIGAADAFAAAPRTEPEERTDGGALDDYVEAQVHGPIAIAEDVEAVVLDPCYRGTPVELQARELRVPLEWHEGRCLSVDALALHPDFRGPEIIAVGRRIAERGMLDARIIGAARQRGDEGRQDLKKVWHLVARFGAPQ